MTLSKTELESELCEGTIQKTIVKIFNHALREMKSGALCSLVDEARQVLISSLVNFLQIHLV